LTNRLWSISNQRWPDMKTDGMFGSILVGASAGGAGIIDGWESGKPFSMLNTVLVIRH
jgi:hypothetical protein